MRSIEDLPFTESAEKSPQVCTLSESFRKFSRTLVLGLFLISLGCTGTPKADPPKPSAPVKPPILKKDPPAPKPNAVDKKLLDKEEPEELLNLNMEKELQVMQLSMINFQVNVQRFQHMLETNPEGITELNRNFVIDQYIHLSGRILEQIELLLRHVKTPEHEAQLRFFKSQAESTKTSLEALKAKKFNHDGAEKPKGTHEHGPYRDV